MDAKTIYLAITVVVIDTTLFFSHVVKAAPATLNPNDIVIITASSDSGWSTSACANGHPGRPNSNAIDLLLRRDIEAGTTFKVTDNAWNGSVFTTTEGSIT